MTPTVVPAVIEYTAKVKHDGTVYELHFPALEVPRCTTCGETYSTVMIDERINDALRSRLRLLTPAQIRNAIGQLGLTQHELAGRLGVAPETISRWVNGALIQSRAMDNLLRVYFAVPEARAVLRGPEQHPSLGIKVDRDSEQLGCDPPDRVNRIRQHFPHLRDAENANSQAKVFQVAPGTN